MDSKSGSCDLYEWININVLLRKFYRSYDEEKYQSSLKFDSRNFEAQFW